ncbi:MAG: lactoylglutathione lyase [Planctomycetota bacterium]|nr:MAG: lactoylglutathione lyase [Planctomycetota bacterium]
MIKQLAHICIHSNDLDKTLHYYTEVLQLEKGFVFEKEGELFGFYIKFGNNTFIEVFKGDPGDVGNINHISIEVEDMDGLIERIKSFEIEIGEKKLGADNSWQVWTEDPNGIRIEFHEYTDESCQLTGNACIVNW